MDTFRWELLIPLSAFVMVSWVFYSMLDAIRRWLNHRALSQFQSKLLDRISSVNELAAFLNTEAGGRFLAAMTSEAAGPHQRILRATQSGIVLTVLGSALFAWSWFSPTIPADATSALTVIATIILALGVGLLLSAVLSYRLSKQMGLLDTDHRHVNDRPLPAA